MATRRSVFDAVVSNAVTACTGIVVNSQTISLSAGTGWPPEVRIMDVPRGLTNPNTGNPFVLMSCVDYGSDKLVTRWPRSTFAESAGTPSIIATLNHTSLPPLGTATITFTGSIVAADSIGLRSRNNLLFGGQTYSVLGTDTTTTVATNLAAAINATSNPPGLNSWITASSSTNVVTLTSTLATNTQILQLTTDADAVAQVDVRRVISPLRLIFWAPTEAIRTAVSEPAVTLFASQSSQFGFQIPSTLEWVRVIIDNDEYVDDDKMKDIYRRDLHMSVEYSTFELDNTYPVDVAQPSFSFGY